MMSWHLAALLLLGGSTVLLFLGIPVAFSFLAINLIGASLYLITLLTAPGLLRIGQHIRIDIVLRVLPARVGWLL